jgi:hypothetical protein
MMKHRKFLMSLQANKSLPHNFISAFNRKKAIQVEKTSKCKEYVFGLFLETGNNKNETKEEFTKEEGKCSHYN